MTAATAVAAAYVVDALEVAIRQCLVDRRWHRTNPWWPDMARENAVTLRALLRVRSAAKRRARR
jgi:hypothetical protein